MVSNGALIAPGMCPSGPRYADDGRTSMTTICWLSRIISAAMVGAISAYPPVVFDTPTVRQAGRRQIAESRRAAEVFIESPTRTRPGLRRRFFRRRSTLAGDETVATPEP